MAASTSVETKETPKGQSGVDDKVTIFAKTITSGSTRSIVMSSTNTVSELYTAVAAHKDCAGRFSSDAHNNNSLESLCCYPINGLLLSFASPLILCF